MTMTKVDEVFEAFTIFTSAIHTKAERNELINNLANRCSKTCGNCNLWMKSRECPIDDQRRGYPSMNHFACAKYIATNDATEASIKLSEIRRGTP